jgi:hypothetical protein
MDLICESGGIESQLYQQSEDRAVIVVKCIFLRDLIEDGLIEKAIENLINLCHPCIGCPVSNETSPIPLARIRWRADAKISRLITSKFPKDLTRRR